MANRVGYNSGSLTLSAGVTSNTDVGLKGSSRVCLLVKNTGANAIGSVRVYAAPNDATGLLSELTAVGAAIGSLAAGATSPLVELVDVAYQQLRVALLSASGSTAVIELAGND